MRLTVNFLIVLAVIGLVAPACSSQKKTFKEERLEMVKIQIEHRGIKDPRVLEAFNEVPREEFVLSKYKDRAYDDLEAPFGFGQTLDRPYENALMVEALGIGPNDRVLEVGTGSGLLASVMSKIAKEVYTIEIEPEIADLARGHIKNLGYKNIQVKTGDGFLGWPEHAPFDRIILSCSPPKVPRPLEEQLAEGGRMLLPLGGALKFQEIVLYKKENGKLVEIRRIAPTVFSPMKGKALEEK